MVAEGCKLEDAEDEMNTCIRCAYCFEGCPVFQNKGWDTDGARGKVILSYGILTGQVEPSAEVAERLFQCTGCRDCMTRCSSNVDVLDIVNKARIELVKAGYASDIHHGVIKNVEETGNIYGDTEVMAPLQDGDTALFLGCQYMSRPNKVKKFIKILEKLDIKPKVSEEICCGFPLEVLGFHDQMVVHKGKFQEKFSEKEAITLCPTCTVHLREGYEVDAKHILEVILEKLPEKEMGKKVTFHDPCDFSRGLKFIEPPRQILNKLGYDLVEMKHNKEQSRCCGGGGGILMSAPELSDTIALARIKEAIETGAETVITTCPTCETVLKKAAATVGADGGQTIQVRNLEDIIWKALKS